jgi:hypothetical protein
MTDIKENVIEWITGTQTITVTFSQEKWRNKVINLQKEHPEDIDILADNGGKCIVAHMPLKYLHLFTNSHEMTDEQREDAAKRMKDYWDKKKGDIL